MRMTFALAFLCALLPAALPAADPKPADPLAGDGNPYSDPVFQDFVETSHGYLNPANTPKLRGGLRDALISPGLPSLKTPAAPAAAPAAAPRPDLPGEPLKHYKVNFAGETGPVGSHVWPLDANPGRPAREYVFLSVLPAGKDRAALLERLEKEAGFRYTGEKTLTHKGDRRTYLLGWAPVNSLGRILRVKGVARAAVERKAVGVPLKTKVAITIKVPFQNRPNAFVPEFVRELAQNNGFDSEGWFRLPERTAASKFSVFTITGTPPVNMVGEVSRSPFVAGVEFRDAAL